jgi:hypothetical protein
MVGEILYFLHRHVRIAGPVALALCIAAIFWTLSMLASVASSLFG